MAIGKDTALRLMIVDDQVNEAEAMVSSLRNAGIAVRPLRAETLDELAQVLAQQQVDMVLAEYASAQMPFDEVARVVMGCGRDVPLLAVLDGLNDDILESVQAQGAQAVALRSRPQQFLKNEPAPGMGEVIERLHREGIRDGLGAFNPPGTSPPLVGIAVPEDYPLPEGYVRHHQTTDDGQDIEAILMFSPDYQFFDAAGQPIQVPANRVVPPQWAPPGLPIRQVRIPPPLAAGEGGAS